MVPLANVSFTVSIFGRLLKKDTFVYEAEVEFVHPVSAGDSVKFLPVVYISPFSLIFLCFFLTKTVEIR